MKCQESSSFARAKKPSSAKNNKNLMPTAERVYKTFFFSTLLTPLKKITELIIAITSPPVSTAVNSGKPKSRLKKRVAIYPAPDRIKYIRTRYK